MNRLQNVNDNNFELKFFISTINCADSGACRFETSCCEAEGGLKSQHLHHFYELDYHLRQFLDAHQHST